MRVLAAGAAVHVSTQLVKILLEVITNRGKPSELDVPLIHESTKKIAQFVPAIPRTTLRLVVNYVIDWARTISAEDPGNWVVPQSIK